METLDGCNKKQHIIFLPFAVFIRLAICQTLFIIQLFLCVAPARTALQPIDKIYHSNCDKKAAYCGDQ